MSHIAEGGVSFQASCHRVLDLNGPGLELLLELLHRSGHDHLEAKGRSLQSAEDLKGLDEAELGSVW